jgi:cytochrome c oxidase subunit 1
MVEITGVRSVNSSAVDGVEPAGAAVRLTMALSGLVLVLMMICGLWLRMSQGGILNMDPAFFYQVMTAHGVGMVGIAGLTGAAMMWFFLARHVQLTDWVYWLMLVLVLLGVAFILGAIFLGGFAGAWTFLYPLPAHSAGVWQPAAAAAFLVGLASVGVGFLVCYLETGRAIIARYGNFSKALGWPLLFGGSQTEVPPPTVVASAAVTVFNGSGSLSARLCSRSA